MKHRALKACREGSGDSNESCKGMADVRVITDTGPRQAREGDGGTQYVLRTTSTLLSPKAW